VNEGYTILSFLFSCLKGIVIARCKLHDKLCFDIYIYIYIYI